MHASSELVVIASLFWSVKPESPYTEDNFEADEGLHSLSRFLDVRLPVCAIKLVAELKSGSSV